jgi:molecular chaperone GrpE
MKHDSKIGRDLEPDDTDDVEIIEVVGLNDDAPPPSEHDSDEVEVQFDETEPAGRAQEAVERQAGSSVAVADDGMRERLLRLQADFENFKKRVERERDDYYRFATSALTAKLLPVIDNLERALATEPRSEGERALQHGVALIHRQFMEELRREGLQAMDVVGEPFDPLHHEAVATEPSTEFPPNTVVEEIQRGYFFRDRVLRPAAVRVAVEASDGAAEAGGEES